jgi:hypothetical protein
MASATAHLALINLYENLLPTESAPDEVTDRVQLIAAYMIELK